MKKRKGWEKGANNKGEKASIDNKRVGKWICEKRELKEYWSWKKWSESDIDLKGGWKGRDKERNKECEIKQQNEKLTRRTGKGKREN